MSEFFDKVTIKNQTLEESLKSSLERLRAKGSRKGPKSESVISFFSAADMGSYFTPMRIALLETLVAGGAMPMSKLAATLKRPRSAVARDVSALARLDVIATESAANPGHGRITVVKPLARRYEFVWSIDAAQRKPAVKAAKRRAA